MASAYDDRPSNSDDPPRIACRKCGAPLENGQPFCGSCGKRVKAPKTGDDDTAWWKTVLGAIVAIPLVVIGLVLSLLLSFGLPALILGALFLGPGDTWDAVQRWVPGLGDDNGDPACAGFETWWDETNERGEEAFRLLDTLDPAQPPDTARMRSMSTALDRIAKEQRESDPPQAARALNGLMVESMSTVSTVLGATANKDYRAYYDATDRAEELDTETAAETRRVLGHCS